MIPWTRSHLERMQSQRTRATLPQERSFACSTTASTHKPDENEDDCRDGCERKDGYHLRNGRRSARASGKIDERRNDSRKQRDDDSAKPYQRIKDGLEHPHDSTDD